MKIFGQSKKNVAPKKEKFDTTQKKMKSVNP